MKLEQLTLLAMLSCLQAQFLALGFVGGRRHLNRTGQQIRIKSAAYMSTNPFFDMASSIFGGNADTKTVAASPKVDAALASSAVSSWSQLRQQLESVQTSDEKVFRQNLSKGYGVGSPLHKLRLFSEENKEQDVRVTFYRDSASWCPYCQKIWLTLEEKKIPYKVEKINMRCYGEKPASFLKVQPGGQIPVAIIDGVTYGQSNDILWALEERFETTHKSLKPPKEQAETAQQYFRLERQLFSAWMYWLTGNGGERAKRDFVEVLRDVELALSKSSGPFFLGNEITQVDVMFSSFLERMASSLLYYKGFMMRAPPGMKTDYPNLNEWFDAMETLPSYQLTMSDYYTHCWDLPPQLGGCVRAPAGAQFEDAINGLRSMDGTKGSWELPLQPHNGGIEPDWTWAGDEQAARREAVERISANHEAIVKFSARGAGSKGMPRYGAALSDPNAISNEAVQTAVDKVLRTVCLALLEGTDKLDVSMSEMATVIVKEGGEVYSGGVVASLAYLRDRIGVPRDMRLPAAQQLRAHLNWAIGKILDATE